MMTESLWRAGRAARRRSVLDTDIVALSAVPPLVARRRQRGLSVTLAKLLPPALVMIAGPQICRRHVKTDPVAARRVLVNVATRTVLGG